MRLSSEVGSPFGIIVKIILLGLALAIAIWAAIPLINAQNWIGLAIVIVATAAMFYIYLYAAGSSRRSTWSSARCS